jgi:hypothetical protein
MHPRTKTIIQDVILIAALTALAFLCGGCATIARHIPGISIGIHHDGGTDLNIGLQLSAPPAETEPEAQPESETTPK